MTQDDNLIGTLTVRETISYSARLRLPDKMPWSEKRTLVERTIIEMGLQDCADTVIGNWHLRGISGGERRRVSIALEILMRPRLLFLDEPTSGLDRFCSNYNLFLIALRFCFRTLVYALSGKVSAFCTSNFCYWILRPQCLVYMLFVKMVYGKMNLAISEKKRTKKKSENKSSLRIVYFIKCIFSLFIFELLCK